MVDVGEQIKRKDCEMKKEIEMGPLKYLTTNNIKQREQLKRDGKILLQDQASRAKEKTGDKMNR